MPTTRSGLDTVAVTVADPRRVTIPRVDIGEDARCDILINAHVISCKPTEFDAKLLELNTQLLWDFSHAGPSVIDILQENPRYNVYLYGFLTSYLPSSGHQAPVYTGILMPANLGPPTNKICLADNQNSDGEIIPFEELGYSWDMSKDPDHGGRVYFLACSEDLTSMTEIDAYRHECAVPFMLSPDDLSTDRYGNINVDRVRFSFTLLDETDNGCTWFPNEMGFNKFIDGLVDGYFDEVELEEAGFLSDEEKETKQAEIKEYLVRIVAASLESTRNQKQETHDSFFESVDYNAADLGKIGLCAIFPINLPTPIKTILPGEYMDKLWKHLGDGDNCRHVFSDHYSIGKSAIPQLLHQLEGKYVFDITDPSLSAQRLHMLSLIDFVFATSGFGTNSDYDITQFLQYLGGINSKFGVKRIIQFIGGNSVMNKVEMHKARYNAYINGLIDGARAAIEGIGIPPSSTMDFLNFLFQEPPHCRRDNLFGAESIRLEANSMTLQLQVQGRWINTRVRELDNFISAGCINELLLRLLLRPQGHALVIPSGARDGEDSADDTANSFDCVKASLLLTTNRVLSPPGKERVKMALPNHEVRMRQLIFEVDKSVKTIQVKEIKANPHETAMTGADEMLAMFRECGGRNHCVYINGSEGKITDPVEGFGVDLPRTNESLRELGISEFRQVFTVRRNTDELSEKRRKVLQKKTGLPYF